MQVKRVVHDGPAENVTQRGAHANAVAQKRNAEEWDSLERPVKVRRLRAQAAHHKKQSKLHGAEEQRLLDEANLIERESI